MMKILGIVGSPRQRGNTHVLTQSILEGAREQGAATSELFLADLDIKECDGCHTCWVGEECPKDDDIAPVYDKIIESDVLVFGTPVYWYGPTALMKCLIDRFVYFNCPENREKIRGKSAAVVIPFEETDPETASLLVPFFEKCFEYLEMNLTDTLLVPGVTKRGEVRKKQDVIEKALDLGRKLALP